MKSKFLRDGRAPIPDDERVSIVMSSNKGKDTSPELKLRMALRNGGFGGYRIHWNVPGKPDIAYPGLKISIFVNGCFWHRCPRCNLPLPKSNVAFWKDKFERNVLRDAKKKSILEEDGWIVITVWECEIKEDLEKVVSIISGLITERKGSDRSKYFRSPPEVDTKYS